MDDQFRLGRLFAPKGRSAFFTATGPKGEAVTIRLIESLNDEEEILARWRRVRDLREEHLVRMLACGQTMLDGTHLVYAVLEATDADLSEVLRDRALTVDETRAMAASVLAGIEVLHGAGLVHEHIEAASVLAQGEVIKLRSDCVREAPEGAQGETLRRRDTHDFAMLVGYAATQRRDAQGMVPRQFDDLVRNGISGTWGLKEMAALLRPAAPLGTAAPSASRVPGGPAAPVPNAASATARGAGVPAMGGAGRRVAAAAAAAGGPTLVGTRGAGAAAAASAAGAVSLAAGVAEPERTDAAEASKLAAHGRPAASAVLERPAAAGARSYSPTAVASALEGGGEVDRLPTRRAAMTDAGPVADEEQRRRLMIPLAVLGAIALLVLLIWFFVHGKSAPAAAAGAVTAPAAGRATTDAVAPAMTAAVKPSAASAARSGTGAGTRLPHAQATAAPVSAPAAVAAGGPGEVWRVVAYTYSRQEQAQGKVNQIAARRPELKAEVYTPTGRSPYLVTVGGWMSAAQAQAERARARRDGLPRDTYAQNYHGR